MESTVLPLNKRFLVDFFCRVGSIDLALNKRLVADIFCHVESVDLALNKQRRASAASSAVLKA